MGLQFALGAAQLDRKADGQADARVLPVVDIACKERPGGCYAGDEKARQHVELRFGDFVDLYQACFADRPHWLRDIGDLEFYLCQCPVAVPKPDATCSEPRLPRVMDDLLVFVADARCGIKAAKQLILPVVQTRVPRRRAAEPSEPVDEHARSSHRPPL